MGSAPVGLPQITLNGGTEIADFFDRFTYLAQQKNESTTSLGTQLGFSKSTISQWRNRKSVPGGKSLDRLASFFDVSVDYLLGKSDIPNADKDLTAEQTIKNAVFGTTDIPKNAWHDFERTVAHIKRKYKIEAK